jgi:hypothetical protein
MTECRCCAVVKRKRLVCAVCRWQSWVGPSVAPIEGVQLRISILKLKRQLVACADETMHRVAHLGFLVFEAVGQRDPGSVFLASRRVFYWLYVRLSDTRDPNCRTPLLAIHTEGDR